MTISAHNPASALRHRVRTPSLVIIELVLDQLPHIGTAGQLLYLSLAQNYLVTPSRLHHELIFFEGSSTGQIDAHAAQVSRAIEGFRKR